MYDCIILNIAIFFSSYVLTVHILKHNYTFMGHTGKKDGFQNTYQPIKSHAMLQTTAMPSSEP